MTDSQLAKDIVNIFVDANELMGLPADDGLDELAWMFSVVFGPIEEDAA